MFYFFTMIAKPDGRHQRSVLLTLLALLAGNAARLYFYNLYQERCMTIDEYHSRRADRSGWRRRTGF